MIQLSTLIIMILILGFMWGGLAYCLRLAWKSEQDQG